MGNKLIDFMQGASNAAASNVSAPVDGLAWLLSKAGVNVGNAPVGGSDWMRAKGLTIEPQNRLAGILGESLGGVAPMLAAAKAPQIARGLLQGAENLASPHALSKQAGLLQWHGPNTKNDMNSKSLKNLISSQRYLDRDIVANKIREGKFDVHVTPEFELDGEKVRAIQDGHHALEAAIRSGNKPRFIENTVRDNDRIQLLRDGNVDGFLEAAYHDSPWYNFATKRDVF